MWLKIFSSENVMIYSIRCRFIFLTVHIAIPDEVGINKKMFTLFLFSMCETDSRLIIQATLGDLLFGCVCHSCWLTLPQLLQTVSNWMQCFDQLDLWLFEWSSSEHFQIDTRSDKIVDVFHFICFPPLVSLCLMLLHLFFCSSSFSVGVILNNGRFWRVPALRGCENGWLGSGTCVPVFNAVT